MKEKISEILRKKWLRNVSLTILLVAIIICLYFIINIGIEMLNPTDIDMTKDKNYSISQQTKDKLTNLDKDVTIYLYKFENYQYVVDFANKYTKINDHIKAENLENLNSKSEWKTEYGLSDSTPAIIVSSGDNEKVLYEYDLITYDYTSGRQIDITEEAITNAIVNVTIDEKPKLYLLTGHNQYSDEYLYSMQSALLSEGNEFETVDLLSKGKVPDDCDVLIITTLKEDITQAEKDYIIDYIKNGGDILLLSDPNINKLELPNFQKVLDEYGISISEGILLEGDSSRRIANYPNMILTNIDSGTSITRNLETGINLCLVTLGKIDIEDQEKLEDLNVTTEILATVSDKAFYRTDIDIDTFDKTDDDEDAPNAVVGAILTKQVDGDNNSKLLVFSNNVFATNAPIQINTQYYMYAIDLYNNQDAILNSLSYLTEREDTITIRKDIEIVNYAVSESQHQIILTIIFGLPIFIIIVGIIVWQVRRRKK